ncbi:hypothetical protein ACK33G_00090 [Aeromonas jandaei]|uniref:hypothetical protein n=1 Tax=Aeromonas jandaei TaxID=650 RepID=UPI0039864D71
MKISVVVFSMLICGSFIANAATDQDRDNARLMLDGASLHAQSMVLELVRKAYYQNEPNPDHAGDALKLGFTQTKNHGRQVGRTDKISCQRAQKEFSDKLYANIQESQYKARAAMTSANQMETEEYIDMLEDWADTHSKLFLYSCLSVR